MVDLSAVVPMTAFGIWSQPLMQEQAGVTISNTTSATPTIEGMVPGNTYVFTWTLSEGTCFNYDADEVYVQVSETPNMNANVLDEELYTCGLNATSILADNPSVGTGTWTTTSAATIVDPDNFSTNVDDLQVGENTFIWSLSSGACENYDADTMVVFVEEEIQVTDDNFTLALNQRLDNQDVLVNDFVDMVNEYEVNIVQQPTQGTVDMIDGVFSYVPNNNAYGIDQFEYEVCNVNCADDCKSAMVTININGLNVKGECWVPNTITPNGNGKNDALVIPCVESFTNNELLIFNRWGDKVFGTTNYANDWTGTYNGSDLPSGTYYYILKLGDNVEPIQGFFTIIR